MVQNRIARWGEAADFQRFAATVELQAARPSPQSPRTGAKEALRLGEELGLFLWYSDAQYLSATGIAGMVSHACAALGFRNRMHIEYCACARTEKHHTIAKCKRSLGTA